MRLVFDKILFNKHPTPCAFQINHLTNFYVLLSVGNRLVYNVFHFWERESETIHLIWGSRKTTNAGVALCSSFCFCPLELPERTCYDVHKQLSTYTEPSTMSTPAHSRDRARLAAVAHTLRNLAWTKRFLWLLTGLLDSKFFLNQIHIIDGSDLSSVRHQLDFGGQQDIYAVSRGGLA